MIIGFIVVAILSGLPNAITGIFGTNTLPAAGLAAGHGIRVVDLLRNNCHFSRRCNV